VLLLKYAVRRVVEAVPLIIGVATIVFFLARLLPGDVTVAFISPTVPETVKVQLREQFGLDRPVMEQYGVWLLSALSGDLGLSFTRSVPVLDVIKDVFPNTLILGMAALIIEMVVGVLLALPTFFAGGKWLEKLFSNALLVVYALPSFWVGMMLLVVFSYGLGVFPSSHMASSDQERSMADLLNHLVLPACTAALPAAAGLARYLRSNVATVMKQEYVLYARSLGLSRKTIFGRYVLPNALAPMVSLLGIEFGILLTGVLVTEVLFSWPGMGQLAVKAILMRDYPLILGCTLVSGVVVVAGNLFADIVNAMLDPRIRITR
jgi:peptide/nickel transport system permease protein